MSFPRDAYPYTNFHELNLGYFIVHFREIFSQWADLYDQMLNWKDATDEELATWKAGVEADLDQRAAALRAELETWKAQTGQDIAGWEDATLVALTEWQTATQAVFEAIRVEAAGSASAAAASAGDAATAKTAAETAQAAAEAAAASVQASAAQITTNTEDIADLKTEITKFLENSTFDFSEITPDSGFGISPGNSWVTDNDFKSYNIELTEDIVNVEITAGQDGGTIAFLNSYNPVFDVTPDFTAGYEGRIMLESNEKRSYAISGNMRYLWVLLKNANGDDRTPTVTLAIIKTDKTLSRENIPADAKATGNAIESVSNEINKLHTEIPEISGIVDYTKMQQTGDGISPGGSWTSSTVAKSTTFRIPNSVKKIRIAAGETNVIAAFLNSYNPVVGATADFSDGFTGRITISANNYQDYNITGNMNYLFVLLKTTSSVEINPEVTLTAVDNAVDPVDSETVDETGKTDMASAFEVMLVTFGECRTEKGVYYVSGIHMPENSKISGSGFESIIKLLATVNEGSAIYMGASSIVRDIQIKGSDATKWIESAEGTRNGIEWTGETQTAGVVDSCLIVNFSGSGIYLHDTTQKTYRNLAISNCYITGNYIGIDVRKNSEFNKITNCTIIGNNVGYRNRGGNNNIANCGVDANITGILIETTTGSTNEGHGTITGCCINHSKSNTGYGIIIKDTGRMLVSNCNIYFSKLRLENTDGNVITGCGFGKNANWEIEGGDCSIFNGCMVRGWSSGDSPVSIVNNTAVKIINCFDRTGVPYTA